MANKSVLELAVETGKWDSGLKKGKKALDDFTSASGGLQEALGKDADKMGTFVRMMGGMESKAKTAKGQLSDYRGTIEQLTMQYNRMTVAQQKSIGRDYLSAIEQLKQKYQAVTQEIQDMNRELSQTGSSGVSGGLFSGLGDKLSGALQVFGGNLMTKAAGAIAGLGSEMAGMVRQSVELAREGEGVRVAFERLGRGDLLQGLREATHGTVADLELMQAAVKFSDFNLPVEELGTMLAFAQQKAKDTGQSIDYMVDSIVTGLGRKSLMILDNLGLSASAIKDRMAETGDMTKAVGDIIREQMSKAGDYVETAADRAAKAAASAKNKMDEFGRNAMPIAEAWSETWGIIKTGALDLLNSAVTPLVNALTEAGRLRSNLNALQGGGEGPSTVDKQIAQLDLGKGQVEKWGIYRGQMKLYREEIEKLQKMADAREQYQSGRQRSGIDMSLVRASWEQYKTTSPEELRRTATSLQKMMDEYQRRALQTIRPTRGGGGTPIPETEVAMTSQHTGRRTTLNAQAILPEGSVAALTKEMQDLRTAQNLVTNTEEWKEYSQQIVDVQNKIKELKGELGIESLRGVKGISISESLSTPTRDDIIKQGEKRLSSLSVPKVEEKEKNEVKLGDVMGQMSSGIQSMASGIEGLGIELPEGLNKVVGGIQSVTGILSGISTILSLIQAVSAADAIIPFAHGGTVKAAVGYVSGRTFSGDMIPARLNAGETVLNQAQAGVIANALQDREFPGGGGGATVQPFVDGEKVFLGMENTMKRMGRGEIVTTSMLRRLGLI